MKYAETICGLALAVILVFVYVRQCIIEKKLYKFKLILSLIILAVFVLSLGFYDIIDKHKTLQYIRDGGAIAGYTIIGLCFFFNIDFATTKSTLESEFVRCLETDKVFILLDKKEKIREVSQSFADLANVSKKDILGLRFLEFLDNYFVINALNDTEVKMSKLKEYFKDWASSVKPDERCQREFLLANRSGSNSFVLNLTDIPIFTGESYKGHLLIGEKDSSENLLSAERKLNDKTSELTNVKNRFSSLLSITDECIFFYNLDQKYIWGNDAFVHSLNLNGNTIGRAEYEQYIHKDDLAYYTRQIAALTPQNPSYDVKYRFKTGANYKFIHEKGTRIFSKGEADEITGTVTLINDSHFEKSNMPGLDSVKDEAQMLADIDILYKQGVSFEVALFKMTNLPDINDEHGRSIGNMVLEEYVKAIKDKFVNDDLIYRISGLEFVIVLTDGRRMNVLQNLLQKNALTNLTRDYGSMHIDISVNFGVTFSNEARNSNEVVKACYKALNMSLLPNYNSNYLYYRDIR